MATLANFLQKMGAACYGIDRGYRYVYCYTPYSLTFRERKTLFESQILGGWLLVYGWRHAAVFVSTGVQIN
jgi:hypothetical protein